jgi:hypothetical protein
MTTAYFLMTCLRLLSQIRLEQDTFQGIRMHVVTGMARDGYQTLPGLVFVLAMPVPHPYLPPAITLDQFDRVTNFHGNPGSRN